MRTDKLLLDLDLRKDITNREDVALLISSFYAKVRLDQVISHHFKDVDWSHHTPVIIDFWSMILLGDGNYKGNPLSKHLQLPLQKTDFDRWLTIFTQTVDELFIGEKADEAKQRALSIAGIFQFKMNLL